MIPSAATTVAVGDSSTARFGPEAHTFPVDAVYYCWASVLQASMQASEPAAQAVVISQNGNTTTSFLPDGSPGCDPAHNVTQCMTYFGIRPKHLFIQFQVNPPNTVSQNIANLVTEVAYAESFGSTVWVCTPHPVLSATDPVIDELIDQRDQVLATFGAKAIDMWTPFQAGNGRDANPAYMQDNLHWNPAGHALAAATVTAATGLGA